MTETKKAHAATYAVLTLVALVAAAAFYSMPLSDVPVGTDSAVFQYVGSVIAQGGAPYVDVFDHKGPLVYALNALTSLDASGWALWALEAAFLAAALIAGYHAALNAGAPGLAAAALGVLLVPAVVNRAEGGNMTEEYCLPFLVACAALTARTLRGGPFHGRQALAMGVAAGCVAALRFTLLMGAVPLCVAAIAATGAREGARTGFLRVLQFLAGFALVATPLLAWLAHAGALEAFWQQYIEFNYVYGGTATAEAQRESLAFLASDPVLVLAAAATAGAAVLNELRDGVDKDANRKLLLVNGAALLLVFTVAALPGRAYGHYALPFTAFAFVPLALLAGLAAPRSSNRTAAGVAGAALVLALVYLPSSFDAAGRASYQHTLEVTRTAVVEQVAAHADGGTVLAVGNECWVYLETGLEAPSPFAYRSDTIPNIYRTWLQQLLAGAPEAPHVLVVADYASSAVEGLAELEQGYRPVLQQDGYTVYVLR